MENYVYCPVQAPTTDAKSSNDKMSRKYLARQVFVCTGLWASFFCYGLNFGSPTVFIAQIRREANSSDAISMDMASWLSSTYNYSGLISTVILAVLARFIGRKFSFLFVAITSSIGSIIFYFSTTTTHLLISEVVQGPLTACQTTISIIMITEYTSPRYRGVFLTMKSAIFFWGVWVANTIGTFIHWKNIGVLAFICSVYSILTIAFCPESPYWLATRDRFEDTARSHRWLKGRSKESEEELEKLMKSRSNTKSTTIETKNSLRKFVKIIKRETFYKPILLCILMISLYDSTGKMACSMYSLEIIKRITKTDSSAYKGMLILDGFTVLGMYVGCWLSKILNRKSLLLITSSIGITCLFTLSLYLYLIYFEMIIENIIVSISLLVAYSLIISIGPMIICTTIEAELIPLKFRNLSILLVSGFAQLLMAIILKMCPFVMHYIGIHGLFLFFAVIASLCTVATYILVPETKDKTLLEIQRSILGQESMDNLSECEKFQKCKDKFYLSNN